MKIMICGGYDEAAERNSETGEVVAFVRSLAVQIIEQNHSLRCSNISSLDKVAIEAAAETAVRLGQNAEDVVVSYVQRGSPARTPCGEVNESRVSDWNLMSGRRPSIPEPIAEADVVIVVGGFGDATGTYTAANWARQAGTPILPVASFGMAARDILEDLGDVVEQRRITGLAANDLRKLTRARSILSTPESINDYASQIVGLAEKAGLSRDVFLIMSFEQSHTLRDYKAAVEDVCLDAGFEAVRTDSRPATNAHQIIDDIHEQIENCGFVIADLTNERPNAYYEIGYARGLDKNVVLTSQHGTDIHFDLQGYNRIVWHGSEDLKEQLRPVVAALSNSFGLTRAP